MERHIALLEKGEKVVQETRGWDEEKGSTFSQRKKESSHDYRYFPEPDLPELRISEIPEFSEKKLRAALPELPWEKRERLRSLGFLQQQDIEQLMGDADLSGLFGETESILAEPALVKIAANFILNDIVGQRKKDPSWPLPQAAYLAEVVRNYQKGILASPQAKQAIVSGSMVATVDERELPAVAQRIVNAHPSVVAEYKAGKTAAATSAKA